MKICLVVKSSPYEVKRHFTEKLAEAMQRHQIEIKIIDLQGANLGTEMLSAIKNFAPDFTCSFNDFESIDGQEFWDILKIPHFSFLTHPAFYSTTLINSPYSMITCVDRGDCETIKSCGFHRVFFWPHAVEEIDIEEKENRIYDVVFLGSCYDFESLRVSWQQRNPAALNKVLDDAIDLVFSDERVSLGQALAVAWQASGLNPQGVNFATLYQYLDHYTRGKDRVELIRSIKHAHVHVFGDLAANHAVGLLGWKPYLGSQPNVTIHPSVPFKKGFEILKQSKIALNSMPFFHDGSHERIFYGLACGCVAVTSESKYLHEQFGEDQGLLFYPISKRNDIDGKIDELVSSEHKRKEKATIGRGIVRQKHNWDQRAKELVKFFSECQ